MQVVVDTNVFVKGSVFERSEERSVLRFVKASKVTLLVTIPVIDEIVHTLYRVAADHGYNAVRPQLELTRAVAAATLVDLPLNIPKRLRDSVPDDPEDAKFVICAHYGNAEYIVSCDKHLLDISGTVKNVKGQAIQVVSPGDFAVMLLRLKLIRPAY